VTFFGCRKQVDQFQAMTIQASRAEMGSHLSLLFFQSEESKCKQKPTKKAHTVHPVLN